jgi:hypothetical protein
MGRAAMKPQWKVTLWYVLFGAIWIFATDRLVESLTDDEATALLLQTLKGWLYVALSGLLLFLVVKRAWDRYEAQEREKREIFLKTVEGAHHILLNYLHQMQLVTMEAEQCRDFDPKLLELAREISDAAATALAKLETVDRLSPREIHEAIHGPSQRPA